MANPFSDIGGDIVSKIFSGAVWFSVAIIVILIVGIIMWYFLYYKKKFDIIVKIKSQRSGDPSVYFDKAAILTSRKDGTKFFRMIKTKVDLPVPPFTIIQKTNWGDYLEIWRKSEDEFIYLTPSKIDKTKILRNDGKLYPIGMSEQKQVEGDISYWNVKRKDKNKKLFDSESLIMKLLPILPQLLGGIFLIFVLYLFLDHLPGILSELKALVSEMRSLKGAEVTTHGLTWILMR